MPIVAYVDLGDITSTGPKPDVLLIAQEGGHRITPRAVPTTRDRAQCFAEQRRTRRPRYIAPGRSMRKAYLAKRLSTRSKRQRGIWLSNYAIGIRRSVRDSLPLAAKRQSISFRWFSPKPVSLSLDLTLHRPVRIMQDAILRRFQLSIPSSTRNCKIIYYQPVPAARLSVEYLFFTTFLTFLRGSPCGYNTT